MRSPALVLALVAVFLGLLVRGSGAQEIDSALLEIVEGNAGFDAETGFIKIAGEVRNRSQEWIRTVTIDIRLFDAAGKPITVTSNSTAVARDLGNRNRVESVLADRNYVPPGEVAPFEYLRDVTKLGAKYASHTLTVSARKAIRPPMVTIDRFAPVKSADGWYSVGGRIKNTGKTDCRSPQAVIAIYGSDGKMFHVTTDTPDATFQKVLKPGAAVAFKTNSIENPGGDAIADVKAWGDCSLIE